VHGKINSIKGILIKCCFFNVLFLTRGPILLQIISILCILKGRLYGSGELMWQVESKLKKQERAIAEAGQIRK